MINRTKAALNFGFIFSVRPFLGIRDFEKCHKAPAKGKSRKSKCSSVAIYKVGILYLLVVLSAAVLIMKIMSTGTEQMSFQFECVWRGGGRSFKSCVAEDFISIHCSKWFHFSSNSKSMVCLIASLKTAELFGLGCSNGFQFLNWDHFRILIYYML